MDKMTLGGYEFWRNPNKFTVPKKDRYTSFVKTYGGAVFFSWGTFIEGVEITLEWEYMTETMFDQLQTLLEADAEIVWNPQTGDTYNVEIRSLEGKYLTTSLLDAEWREDVRLILAITSEV